MYKYKYVHYLYPLILTLFAGMALNKIYQTFLTESFNLVHITMELRVESFVRKSIVWEFLQILILHIHGCIY